MDRRELAAFMQDQKRDQRVRAHGEVGVMPSLVEVSDVKHAAIEKTAPDVLAVFEKEKRATLNKIPDLIAAF
jgi:hypothetical protein